MGLLHLDRNQAQRKTVAKTGLHRRAFSSGYQPGYFLTRFTPGYPGGISGGRDTSTPARHLQQQSSAELDWALRRPMTDRKKIVRRDFTPRQLHDFHHDGPLGDTLTNTVAAQRRR